ncbi:MAG TPA: hypothetical protein VHH09_08105 [Acidimicrobiales bacterium]|nr:hypothetical protein [Acidimicrobiales bacterium]
MSHRLRPTGVAAVVVLWTSLGVGSVLADFDLLGERPLSHLGAGGPAVVLFSGGLALAAVLLVGFHQYVRHSFPVSATFSVAMLLGMAAQLVAAVFPIGGNGPAHRVHTTSALLLGASLPVLMWRFAATQPPGPWRRRSYGLFWAEAAACAVGLWLSARGIAPLAEIVPAVFFHSWILAVTLAPPPAVDPDLASALQPLFQTDRHRVAGLLGDGRPHVGLDGQLVGPVAQSHE